MSQNPDTDSKADLVSEVQEVTLENERPEDLILVYFLKELARAAYGPHPIDLLKNPENFKVFLKNFNYKPDTLSALIPLKVTPSTPKITRACLTALIPKNESAVLLKNGDYILYCSTIRGPFVLSITQKPFNDPLFVEHFDHWNLGVFDPKIFQRNLILNPDLFEIIQSQPNFMQLLSGEQKLDVPPVISGSSLLGSVFFETLPKKGYDVASITEEVQYFSSDEKSERELDFFSLPVLQFTISGNLAKDFFFKITDPLLLSQISSWLKKSSSTKSPSPILTQIQNQFLLYLQVRKKNDFIASQFQDQLQAFLEKSNYSLNYDAIAQEKTVTVYDNAHNFILSQGISSFESLKNSPKVIESLVHKFFVLGTTYFYRSWMTTREFKNQIGEAKAKAETSNRPLKFKVFACSTGEEVLTFAFELLDMGIDNFRIYGTDINLDFIKSARKMIYKRESFERLPDALREKILKKYFKKTVDGYEIKDKPFFETRIRYDVLDITAPFPNENPQEFSPPFDLISCQNIFLYLKPKIVPTLYASLFGMLNENGLFILVDKYYSHSSLKKQLSKYKIIYVNDHIATRLLDSTSPEKIVSILKMVNDSSPTFASIQQYDELSHLSFKEKKVWLDTLLKKLGNHSIIQNLAALNLLNAKLPEEAIEILTDAIYENPYFLNNYLLLSEAHKQLSQIAESQYLTLILKGMRLFYDTSSSKSLQQALHLFQEAIYLRPKDPLGYFVLGYQVFLRGSTLKASNGLLVDYEKFFNEAFKNLKFASGNLGANRVFALRGISEIATALHSSYTKEGNHSIAERLIYNALLSFEPVASKSTEFSTLFNLGKLQILMGPAYSQRNDNVQAMKFLRQGLKTFEKAEAGVLNHKNSLLYDYYVNYARGWLLLHNLLITDPKLSTANISAADCLHAAQKLIDTALVYNSVYGIEAIELRKQLLEADPSLKKRFDETFQTT